MSMTGLEVFDTTVHKTNSWLSELMELLECDEKRHAYDALRATLHALRDRLTVDETAQLGAQLPMLIRGFYYEQWDPSGKPLKIRDLPSFLALIAQELAPGFPCDPEDVARGVFALLAARITDGEIQDLKQLVPGELRALWP
jgi:uncharacterized protein (DUF2267 family)